MRKKAQVLVGMNYGDEAKGAWTDYLTRANGAHTVIRYNGAGQAAHNVHLPDGTHHTFSSFGSGTFAGAETHLSRFFLVSPLAMLEEAETLSKLGHGDIWARTTMSELCPIVTPYHRAVCRLREIQRGDGRHGSVGMGIGECVADSLSDPESTLLTADLSSPTRTREKLAALQEKNAAKFSPHELRRLSGTRHYELVEWLVNRECTHRYEEALREFRQLARIRDDGFTCDVINRPGPVIFEGAQGLLLDEWRGFHPYTTWSDCTPANALSLLREAGVPREATEVIGLTRAYATRHGPGPFPTECTDPPSALSDRHNRRNDWQLSLRLGHLDLLTLEYAAKAIATLDCLALSHLDQALPLIADGEYRICRSYEWPDHLASMPSDLFRHDSECRISGIKLGPGKNLEHQARLAQALNRVKPLTETQSGENWTDSLKEKIRETVGYPIRYLSYGPTHTDRTGS